METECQLSRALCFFLGVSRLFGIAPLRFHLIRQGCRVSISPIWTIYGFISLILTGGAGVIILFQVVFIQAGLRSLHKLSATLRIFNYLIALYIAVVGTITASRRMKRLILNTNKLEQIHIKVGHDISEGNSWKAWAPIPYTILGIVLTTFNLVSLGNNNIKEEKVKSTWFLIIYIWFHSVLTLLMYHLSFTMIAIYNTLKALNHGSTVYVATAVKGTTFSLPDSLCSRPSTKTVNEYGVQYCAVCDIIFDINDKESSLYFAIFAQHFLSASFTIYLLATAIREGKTSVIILQMLWMLYNLSRIIINIEACHYVKSEMEKAKAIICNVGCAESADKQLLQGATDILQHLSLIKNIFSPLGVFSLTRSFIVTTFSFITTFVVILIQFKLFDE